MTLAVDVAHWRGWPGAGVVAWLYRNCTANIVASLIWAGPPAVVGFAWGGRRARRTDAHRLWMARTQAAQHRAVTGQDPPPHPLHGALR